MEAYVAKLVEVFREVRRVLRDDGTLWLNLGDSYKEKQLLGITWRVAFALQADGWYLRQDIIWHKPNPMPESVTDRCTKAHEYIFLLSKSERYYYDIDAMKEKAVKEDSGAGARNYTGINGRERLTQSESSRIEGRNRRSVWTIATQPYPGAHFAAFPPDLIRPCIQAGCPKECCAKCGAPLERVVEKTTATPRQNPGYTKECTRRNDGERPGSFTGHTSITLGFSPTCSCDAGTVPGIVLDPFGGSGTTAQVAIQEGRNAVIIELNPKYIKLAQKRISGTQLPLIS
jgi:DNA modification methylase